MIAASLWALDGLLRSQLTESIQSITIVFYEHVVGFVLLLPFFIRAIPKLRTLNRRDWVRLLGLAVVSSVLGTVLFTEAFARSGAMFDFATPILLQKLQPVFVIVLSWLFLKEKISVRFSLLAIVALIGSYLISFGSDILDMTFTGKEEVFLLAVGAAIAWGSGTILSKKVLAKLSFSEATSMRFLLAIPISFLFIWIGNQTFNPAEFETSHWVRFLIIGVTTGAGAILIYYRGLKITQAKVSTFAELMFPIISIIIAITALNPFGEPQVLVPAQYIGIGLLLVSIVMISLTELPSRTKANNPNPQVEP